MKHLFLPLILSVLFFSCSSNPDHLKLIPEDSPMVGTIDFLSIGAKASIEKFWELDVVEDLEEIAKEDRDSKKIYKKYVDNFSESMFAEINFLKGATYFVIPTSVSKGVAVFGLAFDIKDHETIEDGIEDLIDETGLEYELDKMRDNDFGFAFIEEIGCIAWDNETAVYLIGDRFRYTESIMNEFEDIVEDLYESKNGDSNILNNASFSNFYKNKGDLGLWTSADAFLDLGPVQEIWEKAFEEAGTGVSLDDVTKDSYYIANLNFNKGEVVLNFEVEASDYMKETTKNLYNGGVDKEMLKIFPGNSLLLGSASINASEMLNSITDNLQVSEKREFENAEDELVNMFNNDFKFDALASRMGSIVGGIIGYGEVEYQVPVYKEVFENEYLSPYDNGNTFSFITLTGSGMDKMYGDNISKEERNKIANGEWARSPAYPNYTFRVTADVLETIREQTYQSDLEDIWIELIERNPSFEIYFSQDSGWSKGSSGETTSQFKELMQYGFVLEFENFSKLQDDIEEMFEQNMEIYEELDDNFYYMLADSYADPIYMSYNKDYIFVSNNQTYAKKFLSKKYDSKNFSSTSTGKSFTNNPINMYMNMDLDNMDDYIVEQISYEMGYEVIDVLEDITESLEYTQISPFKGEFSFKTKGDTNIFGVLMKEINNLSMDELMNVVN